MEIGAEEYEALKRRVKEAESERDEVSEWGKGLSKALDAAQERMGDDIESLEARLRAAEEVLTDIASWDEEEGHDGHHHGPCVGCQRVFTVRKVLNAYDKEEA